MLPPRDRLGNGTKVISMWVVTKNERLQRPSLGSWHALCAELCAEFRVVQLRAHSQKPKDNPRRWKRGLQIMCGGWKNLRFDSLGNYRQDCWTEDWAGIGRWERFCAGLVTSG